MIFFIVSSSKCPLSTGERIFKKSSTGKKYQPKWQKYRGADPNYPIWGNSDQLDKTGGVIRITPAEIAVLSLPHLLPGLYRR